MIHQPVLLKEVIECLNIQPGAKIIDATINGGGHARGILAIREDVRVLGIELDPEIFESLRLEVEKDKAFENLTIVNDNYTNLKEIVRKNDFEPDGIVFDLGLSSRHYESGRGFSFRKNEILDMRFNSETTSQTAADIINKFGSQEIEDILRNYGEEQFAGTISRKIIEARKIKPIITTEELVKIIGEAVPEWYKHKKIHFATKTFQALRIKVNGELVNVKEGLLAGIEVLKPGGRLVAISFHGLEDKIVKDIFKQKAKEGIIKFVTKKTIKPNWQEQKANPRSRSAKMKVVEKI